MSIEIQINNLNNAVDELIHCINSLKDDMFLQKITNWTPRDIAAHLTGWNRYIIKGSDQIIAGELPFYDIDPGENYCNINAVIVSKYSTTDRNSLLKDLRTSANELIRYLEMLDSVNWDYDFGVRHKDNLVNIRETIVELIADYHHHRKQIDDWLKQ